MADQSPPIPPPGWGDDLVTELIDAARSNQFATFDNKRNEFNKLVKIDECFCRIIKDWINPSDLLAPMFMMRSHSAFRTALGCAMAGQIAEVYPLLRTSLEYSGYALHINRHKDLAEVWLNRHDSAANLKEVRNKFTTGKIRETIEISDKMLGGVFEELYQRAIDYGGHPNERGLSTSTEIKEMEGRKLINQAYLHGDGIMLDHALKTVSQSGICTLLIFQEIFGPRFELLGVHHDLLELQKGL